ncbi:DUF72 domain-containing protein [Massilia sp. Mn16-1_5]|uniref:DUF72 domain-containing protein n=1 Tax=Massilia sp. Mn16-1_5 TaxID=2079199 RepID=UPI00109E9304|nr:DUF72 domain-containing protein [Massilia sp. Mn16-1_5]THC46563.1 DUF72 domain-containing protein [Massilia sp. Mn16-1_5]
MSNQINPAPLIGCAGWNIPKEAAAAFPPSGSHLERYAAVFRVVEINSSFYKPHQPKTYARWAESVPSDFRFAVKVPRAITHDAQMRDIDALLARFAGEVKELKHKLGCLLVQTPPKLGFHDETVRDFFLKLQDSFGGCMIACEGRHPSWFSELATEVLRERKVTRVIADPAAGQPGPHVPTTEDIYVRLHGTPRIYYSAYSQEYLDALVRDLALHRAAGRRVWCIFDNTAAGEAVPNALDVLRATGGGLER